ncbi:MAG: energy-dependent translational throttle protein EttA, partial [Gemmatimonadaceae bacterium]|nr:energy-dependent translational throttle protein EttA [Gemmatimonadaceae bacterium]
MAPQFIYVMKALRKVVPPSRVILDDIWLSFYPGAKIGVLGANGAGKSSLLRIMAGVDQDFQGEAWAAKGTKIGYLSQEPQLDPSKNVRENVELAVAEQRQLLNRFNEISAEFADPEADFDKLMAEQARVQERIDTLDLWNLDNKIEVAMDALRLPPDDADVTKLSGGEKRRVALCRVLLEQPDMLLLDEPTNHLDAESVEWLEHFLADFPGTVVAVTHDRYFLDNVAKWILELDRGKGIPWEGNYSSWLDQKKNRLAQEEKSESARQRSLQRELEWVRMAPRARQAKSKARIQKFEELQAQDTGDKVLQHEITIPPPPRLGNDVVIAKGVKKSFGDKLLFDDLSFALPRGGIVGVIGPNGAGKTTLFRMIVGEEKPDGGDLRVGETVSLAYVDQGRVLDGAKTAYQEVSGGQDEITVGNREINSRAYLSQFNFRGTDQQK